MEKKGSFAVLYIKINFYLSIIILTNESSYLCIKWGPVKKLRYIAMLEI